VTYPQSLALTQNVVDYQDFWTAEKHNQLKGNFNGVIADGFANFNKVVILSKEGSYTNLVSAITAASALSPSASNKVLILVLPGEYDSGFSLPTLPDYVSIRGISKSLVNLTVLNSTNVFRINGNHEISNLTLTRISGATPRGFIDSVAPCEDVTIKNCDFIGADGGQLINDGEIRILMSSIGGKLYIEDCLILNQGTFPISSAAIAIKNMDGGRAILKRVSVLLSNYTFNVNGIDILNPILGTPNHVIVENCVVLVGDGVSRFPVRVSGYTVGSVETRVMYNSFRGNVQPGVDIITYQNFINSGQVI
jgi:hypothetical protein